MIYTEKTSLYSISESVANYFDISIYDMFKKTRKKHIVNARSIFCHLSRKLTKNSLNDIAEFITFQGKRDSAFDHATVLHADKKTNFYLSKYIEDRVDIENLEYEIKSKSYSIIVSDVNLLRSIYNL